MRLCNLSSSARGIPDVFTVTSESSAKSHPVILTHVQKRCKKIARFSRPRNSGAIEGINIPMLADGAGAVSMGAAAVGAVAQSPCAPDTFSLVQNSSSEKFWFSLTSSWRKSLLNSAIFLTTEVTRLGNPWLENPTGSYAKRVS